jgi:hypothetical protein
MRISLEEMGIQTRPNLPPDAGLTIPIRFFYPPAFVTEALLVQQ